MQERKSVANAGLKVRRLTGDAITPAHWEAFYQGYINTTGCVVHLPAPALSPAQFMPIWQKQPGLQTCHIVGLLQYNLDTMTWCWHYKKAKRSHVMHSQSHEVVVPNYTCMLTRHALLQNTVG